MMWTAPLGRRRALFTMGGLLVSLVSLLLLTAQPSFADHPINGVPPAFSTEPPADKVVDLMTFEDVGGLIVNLDLPCATTGTPTPTVTWFRGDTQIDAASVLSDGRLAINVTESEAARGGTMYYCMATNRIGPGNSTTASLRSRDVNVSHSFFDGFEEMNLMDVPIQTIEGGAVALECDFLASNPAPVVQWFVGETTTVEEDRVNDNRVLYLEGGRFLYIRALNAAERGMRYHCEVTNFRDVNNSPMRAPTTYTLNNDLANTELMTYKELGTQIGLVGEELEFVYAAAIRDTNDALIDIFLRCPSNTLVILGVRSAYIITATLRTAAETMSQVDFTCNLNIAGAASRPISGTIIVSRAATITDPTADAASLVDRERFVNNGAVRYPCVASGIPEPDVAWFYNGEPLMSGSGVVVGSDSLTIAEPQVGNSGIYQCFASNRFGEEQRTWILEVREPVLPEIEPLTNTSAGVVEDRLEGNLLVERVGTPNVMITTVVNSDPCPAVQWTFRGVNITNGSDFTMTNPCDSGSSSPYTFMLTIAMLTEATSGPYSALFTILGDRTVSLDSLFVTIPNDTVIVQDLEVVIDDGMNRPEALCLLGGSNVIMTCVIDGFPRPDVIFRNGSVPIMPGSAGFERVTQISMDQIRIQDISMYDQAQYTCEARTRPLDGPSQTIILTPTPGLKQYCTQPRIVSFRTTENPREGNELLIECIVEGTPTPSVTWIKDNVTLDNNIISMSGSGVAQVRIDPATLEDSGIYRCIVRNDAGSDEQTFRVEVNKIGLDDIFTTAVIIGIVAGGAGLILLIVLLILLLICVYLCARRKSSDSADLFAPYNVDYTPSGDGRGNVDADSYDGGQAEAFDPDYDSVPTRRPHEPPPYKDTPGYQHGAPLAGDDMEMIKYPPQDSESFVTGAPPFQRPDNGYRPTPSADDFMSEDAQFV